MAVASLAFEQKQPSFFITAGLRCHPWVFAVAFFIFSALTGKSILAAQDEGAKPFAQFKVNKISNVTYYDAPDADKVKHKLDLYLPKGKKGFPVILYAHGGGWQIGYKNQLGMPAGLGRSFARRGIGFVSINYRLYPKVKHPEHVRDAARAFAWTYRNIGKYGGKNDEVFVCGHSAGAHLMALLATNEKYLKEQDLSLRDVRGAMTISGLFNITSHRFFTNVFGKNAALLKDASPIHHGRADSPPFLVLYADNDFPHCDRPKAQAFYKAMKSKKARIRIQEMKQRNHFTMLWLASGSDDDPVNRALYRFVVSNVVLHRLATDGVSGIDTLREFLK